MIELGPAWRASNSDVITSIFYSLHGFCSSARNILSATSGFNNYTHGVTQEHITVPLPPCLLTEDEQAVSSIVLHKLALLDCRLHAFLLPTILNGGCRQISRGSPEHSLRSKHDIIADSICWRRHIRNCCGPVWSEDRDSYRSRAPGCFHAIFRLRSHERAVDRGSRPFR